MRSLGWFLLATMLLTTTGCGGCGSSNSLAEMKRRAIKRTSEDDEAPPAPPAAPPAAAPAPAEPVAPPMPMPMPEPMPPMPAVAAAEPPPMTAAPTPMPVPATETPPAPAVPPVAVKPPETKIQPGPDKWPLSPQTAPNVASSATPSPELSNEGPPDVPIDDQTPMVASLDPKDAAKPLPPMPPAVTDAPVEDQRREIPDADAQKAGKRILAELYKADYEQARTPAQKVALAQQLLAKAEEIQGDVVGHYLLLNLVYDVALKSGDVGSTMQAIDALNANFKYDGPSEKYKALDKLGKALTTDADAVLYLQECGKVLKEACAKDNFELSQRAYDSAMVVAKRMNKQAEINQLTAIKKVLDEGKTAYANVPAAKSMLQQDPAHADSHLAVGKYLCLYHRNWEQGLPHLAQASDIKLKVLAQIDISAPNQGQQQADLGDQWYDLAIDARPFAQKSLAARAGYWYSQAFNALPSGLLKSRVQKRLQEIADLTGDTSLQAFTSTKKALPQD